MVSSSQAPPEPQPVTLAGGLDGQVERCRAWPPLAAAAHARGDHAVAGEPRQRRVNVGLARLRALSRNHLRLPCRQGRASSVTGSCTICGSSPSGSDAEPAGNRPTRRRCGGRPAEAWRTIRSAGRWSPPRPLPGESLRMNGCRSTLENIRTGTVPAWHCRYKVTRFAAQSPARATKNAPPRHGRCGCCFSSGGSQLGILNSPLLMPSWKQANSW